MNKSRPGVRRSRIEKSKSTTFIDVHSRRVYVITERKVLAEHLKIIDDYL